LPPITSVTPRVPPASAPAIPSAPDPEFYKTLAKALEEIAAGLEQLSQQE
jgi:hypothetical protein